MFYIIHEKRVIVVDVVVVVVIARFYLGVQLLLMLLKVAAFKIVAEIGEKANREGF